MTKAARSWIPSFGFVIISSFDIRASSLNLHRFFADLFRADAHGMLYRKHEHFSVPDLARFGGGHHYAHCLLHHVVRHYHFHFHFRQKIDGVFTSPINLGVAFLPTEPFDFRDGHSLDSKLSQRLFDLLELERFDDGFQFFHVRVNSASHGLLQSKANRSTRSLSNAAIRLQSRIFALRWHPEQSEGPHNWPRIGAPGGRALQSDAMARRFAKDFF